MKGVTKEALDRQLLNELNKHTQFFGI